MRFRPTPAQALGSGAYVGALIGLVASPVVMMVVATRGLRLAAGVVGVATVVGLCLLGGVVGAAAGRRAGADIDDRGIHPAPAVSGLYAPWHRIADLRTERCAGRVRVVVAFDTGQVARLRAPYDGRLLAADPAFERKVFMLRHLWAAHRDFGMTRDTIPATPPPGRAA